jgi:hypothetical protein
MVSSTLSRPLVTFSLPLLTLSRYLLHSHCLYWHRHGISYTLSLPLLAPSWYIFYTLTASTGTVMVYLLHSHCLYWHSHDLSYTLTASIEALSGPQKAHSLPLKRSNGTLTASISNFTASTSNLLVSRRRLKASWPQKGNYKSSWVFYSIFFLYLSLYIAFKAGSDTGYFGPSHCVQEAGSIVRHSLKYSYIGLSCPRIRR